MATSTDPAPGDGVGGVILPPVPLSMRRQLVVAIVVGVVALVATMFFDRLLLGALICVGLLIGSANTKLALLAAVRITSVETPSKQKMAMSSASRLLVITAVALVIGFLLRPNGIGLFFGLAVFQVIQVLSTALPVLKGLRQQS
jgi:hypothetical protein